MKKKALFILFALCHLMIWADDLPSISPIATFETPDGEEENTVYSGSAPLVAHFKANPTNVGVYRAFYEWRFYMDNNIDQPYLVRYDENTDYTFEKAGVHHIVCFATFINGTDTVAYTREYWNEIGAITVSISESKLEMPNAFSPNNDGVNDIYKAKSGYQSLVEFHAFIFNRWGQTIYEWSDPAGGWDGKFNGKDVKQGVYFCLVKAKGADGRVYNIKTDVNLLRGYTEGVQNNQE